MKILIAGMPQSGSTALYNIVRLYMEYHDIFYENFLFSIFPWTDNHNGPKAPIREKQTVNEYYLESFQEHYPNRLVILKEHHYNEFLFEWADLIFVCRRDIRDAIASRRRRGKDLISKSRYLEAEKYDPNTFWI